MLLPINAPGPQGRHTVTGCGLKFLYARVQPLTSGPELYIIEALFIQASTAYLYRIDMKLQGRVKSGARVAPLNLAGRGTSSNSSFRALRVSMEDGRVLESGIRHASDARGAAWIREIDTLRMQTGED